MRTQDARASAHRLSQCETRAGNQGLAACPVVVGDGSCTLQEQNRLEIAAFTP